MPQTVQCELACFHVVAPSVWNFWADYLIDLALELNSFRHHLGTLLGTTYRARLIYYDYALYKWTVYLLAYLLNAV